MVRHGQGAFETSAEALGRAFSIRCSPSEIALSRWTLATRVGVPGCGASLPANGGFCGQLSHYLVFSLIILHFEFLYFLL